MDPTNFRVKIHEISALGAKRDLNVARSAPDVKISLFGKVLPELSKIVIFRDLTVAEHVSLCLCGTA